MKKLNLWALIVALLFLSQFSQNVRAVDLITNGSFETGTFAGWTVVNGAGAWFNWQNSAAGNNTGFHTSSPQHGTRSAWNGVAGNAGAVFSLTQQVTIPAGNTASLSWRNRFQLDNNSFCNGAACGSATFQVQILNTSNIVLQTIYNIAVGPDQVYDSGWVLNNVNLNAYSGQTIQIRFRNSVTQTLAGPGMAEIDQVVLNSLPTTAADATVGGRVVTAGGQGIRNVSVTITAPDGTSRTTTTGSFGYYNFENIEVGRTYIITVTSKRFRISDPTRVVSVNDNIGDVDFVSTE